MRQFIACLIVLGSLQFAAAQDEIRQGKIHKIDPKNNKVTISVPDADKQAKPKLIELVAAEEALFIGPDGNRLKDGLADPQFKEGAQVQFKSTVADGKNYLVGMRVAVLGKGQDQPIRRGTIKKVDAKKGTLVISADGKDIDLVTREETRYMDADGQFLQKGLSDPLFKVGTEVMFKAGMKDGVNILIGMRIPPAAGGAGKEPIKVDTTGMKPLTELGQEKYRGFEGGLYPGGKNERPPAHEKAGISLAALVRPLDASGKPDPSGKIVLISVGMSNTTQVFSAFKRLADKDADKNPNLIVVDCAMGGQTAARIQDPTTTDGQRYWSGVDARLKQAGVTREQVQAVWIKEADGGPTQGFPKYAQKLQDELGNIVRIFPKRFPNAKLVYLSSRTYGGFASTRLNPDPYAFESGFSVKWLIEQQIKGDKTLNYDPARGDVAAPWLSWGPYLWANGTTKRADGFYYEPADFAGDGTHPSAQGQEKIARELLRFFKNDTTTRPWFVR